MVRQVVIKGASILEFDYMEYLGKVVRLGLIPIPDYFGCSSTHPVSDIRIVGIIRNSEVTAVI